MTVASGRCGRSLTEEMIDIRQVTPGDGMAFSITLGHKNLGRHLTNALL